jgi:hypothetical protein
MDALEKTSLHPSFREEADLRLVELSEVEYMRLLASSNEFAPDAWPPGKKHGAALLKRIRDIEARCIFEHGSWDWELLSPELQDEYDGASIDLARIVESTLENWITIEDYMRTRGISVEDV